LLPIEVVITFPVEDVMDRYAMVERAMLVERVRQGMEALPQVEVAAATTSLFPTIPTGGGARQASARGVIGRKLTENRRELARAGFLHEAVDVDSGGDVVQQSWRITARTYALQEIDLKSLLGDARNQAHTLVDEGVRQHAQTNPLADPLEPDVRVSGGIFVIAKAQQQLLEDLINSFALAFVLIIFAMMLLVRNLGGGLLSMIPNVFPSLVIFGAMGWLGLVVDIGTMMTASVALGIAVDDTSHFLAWYRRGLALDHGPVRAVRFAFSKCATAMLYTTLICGIGMLPFVMSEFVPVSRFAWLMCALLVAAIVGDLVLLPALLVSPLSRMFVRRKHRARAATESGPDKTTGDHEPAEAIRPKLRHRSDREQALADERA